MLRFLSCYPDCMQLALRVKPDSRVNALSIDSQGRLQLALKASPQEGKANKMLVSYLAKRLKLTQKQILITSGLHAREKKIRLLVGPEEQARLIKELTFE